MRKMFFGAAMVVGVFFAQLLCTDLLSVYGAFPNLLLLAAIFAAVNRGPVAGVWSGFALGFMADVMSLSLFGSQMFGMTLTGYVFGRVQGKIDEEKIAAQLGLSFAGSILYLLVLVLLELLFVGSAGKFWAPVTFLQLVYNLAATPVLFWLMNKWMDRAARVRSFV